LDKVEGDEFEGMKLEVMNFEGLQLFGGEVFPDTKKKFLKRPLQPHH